MACCASLNSKSWPFGKKSPWLLGQEKTVTVCGTASSLILVIICPQIEQVGVSAGSEVDLGRTESTLRAVSIEMKLAV